LRELSIEARVIDHGLQAGSAGVAARAAAQAEALGLPAEVVAVAVPHDGSGVEAAARSARYRALAMGEPALIALGHTLDDQAETVLLGLARGSGTRSLAGMPQHRLIEVTQSGQTQIAVRGQMVDDWRVRACVDGVTAGAAAMSVDERRPGAGADIDSRWADASLDGFTGPGKTLPTGAGPAVAALARPLLSICRTQTMEACRQWGLEPWEDPTNSDPRFSRSRLRAAMPLLVDTLGPGLIPALARTARLCRDDADALDDWADQWAECRGEIGRGGSLGGEGRQGARSSTNDNAARHRIRSLPNREPTVRDTGPDPSLPLSGLADLPAAIRRRLLIRWLRRVGVTVIDADHVVAVEALIIDWHGQKGVSLPGGWLIQRRVGRLSASRGH
jgi:tRNA(Ile)-lysidine synthase